MPTNSKNSKEKFEGLKKKWRVMYKAHAFKCIFIIFVGNAKVLDEENYKQYSKVWIDVHTQRRHTLLVYEKVKYCKDAHLWQNSLKT